MTAQLLHARTAISDLRELLALGDDGLPVSRDIEALVGAIGRVLRAGDAGLVDELLTNGLLRHSRQRYAEHVAPLMRPVGRSEFLMGTTDGEQAHFCGETPQHSVQLSPFAIAAVPVTNELYALLDRDRLDAPAREPAVDVTWFDAAFFALWVGCRLPTEAEWELSCSGGASTEWCCADEEDLARYAWFSENAEGRIHDVATREPNALGLHDLHGNVWEWCADVYDQDFYASSPALDPVARGSAVADRVTRGGCMHSFAEMCRTRHRFHEPPRFWAFDLGFRLARSIDVRPTGGIEQWLR
jgi:formylglycine-generating enzyme required for sulfatase activity